MTNEKLKDSDRKCSHMFNTFFYENLTKGYKQVTEQNDMKWVEWSKIRLLINYL